MTKEEIIQEAYGEYWEIHKDKINEDGWINQSILSRADFSSLQFNDKANKMRPLELRGIEDNNGWVQIGDDNLIHFEGDLWGLTQNNEIYFYSTDEFIEKGYLTHYQPIIKPKPPIY